MRPTFNSVYFYDNAEVLFNGESTQTYFVNVCGYWPGLVTGLEVVGSIMSTKREKERKEKHFVCYLQRRQTLMTQSTVMQHIHRWSFIWRLPWPWKPLNKIQSLRGTQHIITVFDIKSSFVPSQHLGVIFTF